VLPGFDRATAGRVVVRGVTRVVVSTVVVGTLYFALPLGRADDAGAIGVLVAGFVLVLVVIGLQLRAILTSPNPQVRAVESVVVAFEVFIGVFAVVYFVMSNDDPTNFSEPLSRIDALYFAVTTLTTVGFGDIVPVQDGARLAVTLQMVFDVAFIAIVARVLLGLARRRAEGPAQATDDGARPTTRS
jgi:voltage-gated potassium channel Kch